MPKNPLEIKKLLLWQFNNNITFIPFCSKAMKIFEQLNVD